MGCIQRLKSKLSVALSIEETIPDLPEDMLLEAFAMSSGV